MHFFKTVGVGLVLGLAALIGLALGLGVAIIAGVSRRAGASLGTVLIGCVAMAAFKLLRARRRSASLVAHVRGAASPATRPGLA